ncbi:GNAT family N-acetyltransferase [Streptomyces orinoci]|uniref:GNAT family N-acetyltransferase n=1 Tax=Streptomyces orinoci TaxID=67339 RepID=A0ABV3K066_STRON|nr:GNAT family N-acetyltransferase [Streptomyces orinoci]
MNAVIERAGAADVAELRQLYYAVYGPHYPVARYTDPAQMAAFAASPDTLWLTARCGRTGALVGSAAIQGEPGSRLGRLEGLAVHPEHRASGLAGTLTEELCERTLGEGRLDSVYATVRTVSTGPQRVVSRHGFRPMGIMPNTVECGGRENLALYARYSAGVLQRRIPVPEVPAPLRPLLRTVERTLGLDYGTTRYTAPAPAPAPPAGSAALEVIEAPGFVRRRFTDRFPDSARWFYPLHTPNTLLLSEDGRIEVYACVSRAGSYGALVAGHPEPAEAAGWLEPVTRTLFRAGVGYLEALLPLARHDLLSAFLAQGYIPSALYPAMRPDGEGFQDYVVMSRTAEQIDFRALVVEEPLRPYLDAYASAWASTYLPSLEVVS